MEFKVRDKRRKERFYIDDEYLNGASKKVGIFGTGVYLALCRYANQEQTCFPSQERMAEQLAISLRSVQRGLQNLEKYRIIVSQRIGKNKNNEYWLLDHREWELKGIRLSDASRHAPQTCQDTPTGRYKVTHSNDTHIRYKRESGENAPTPKEKTIKFLNDVKNNSPDIDKHIMALSQKTGIDNYKLKSEILKFTLYWTELNSTGRKQRWELQPTFEINRRLYTWLSKMSSFNRGLNTGKNQLIDLDK